MHGAIFDSYVGASRPGAALCAWRLTLPPGAPGTAHRPSQEEVMLVLAGEVVMTLDGVAARLVPGEVALVPAQSLVRIDAGEPGAELWVTTTPGWWP